jgi:UDP-N-acetylglucosamine acyltransferase
MIHGTAVIDPGAKLGKDVSVGPFAYIERDVQIGDGCVIGPHVCILRYTTLGEKCRVHAGAVLGDVPQDLAFQSVESFVRIGANCLIREGVTIHRGTKAGTVTEVGDGCFLMANSHLAHNVKLGKGVILANGALLGGYVEVGDRAFISGNCLLHQFTRVGRLVIIGGGGGASKDVPPFCMVPPLRSNRVAGLNVIGLRRAGFNPEQRSQIKEAFKILYRSGLSTGEAVAKIEATFKTGPALEFCEFVKSSKRGICGREIEEAEEAEA